MLDTSFREYDALLGDERPKLVEVISWAAGNGDRSENGDYIYGRKRLRGAAIGDLRTVQLPAGPKEWEVIAVSYP